MRGVIIIAVCVALLSGCARPVKPVAAARLLQPPFADDPVSFVVSGQRFPPGEVTIVQVCVASDRTIVSANVTQSSGDVRFDRMALVWARQIKLRSASASDSPLDPCGQVRVEIRVPSEPRVLSGSDTALG